MAKTVDELVVKVSVEGSPQLDQANAKLDALNETTKKATTTLNGFQVRNVSAQIQDMAVQLEMGTNAFRVMGQQLPQLLSAFGTTGVVIGAIAAVTLPLLQYGLKLAGVDMRNLQERTTDLTNAVKQYQAAQASNLPTLAGLGNTYGSLTGSAKDFFEIQEKLTKQKANVDLAAALKELNHEFIAFDAERLSEVRRIGQTAMSGAAETAIYLGQSYKALALGLTKEQATVVSEQLKGIDKASPEKAAETLNNVLKYLQDSGVEAGKLKRFFDETVEPILKVNNQLLETKKSLTEAGQQASDLSTKLLESQTKSIVDVGNARRSFDQVKAIGIDAQQKIFEFTTQANEKSSKDGVDRSKEIAAFNSRANAEALDKQKDFYKTQSETYKGALLQNDAKQRQLKLESEIIDIQDKGRYDMAFNIKFSEDVVRLEKEHADTLVNIGEQRRKNLITASDAKKLEQDALAVQAQGVKNAEQARAKAVKDFVESSNMDNMKKSIEEQIALAQKLGDSLVTANRTRSATLQAPRAEQLVGLSTIEKQIVDIQEQARKSAQAAKEAFAAAFTAREDGMTPSEAEALATGIDKIDAAWKRVADTQKDVAKSNYDVTRSFNTGVKDAWKGFVENATDDAAIVKNSFTNFTTGLEDAFVKLAQGGKLSFSDLANSIIADLARIAVRKAVVGIGSFFGLPGLAAGGPVTPNQAYIVGEKGPELFLPTGAGSIVPNNKLGSGSSGGGSGQANVTYNIQAVDAQSFRSLVARDPSFIYAVTEQGRRSQPVRSR